MMYLIKTIMHCSYLISPHNRAIDVRTRSLKNETRKEDNDDEGTDLQQ